MHRFFMGFAVVFCALWWGGHRLYATERPTDSEMPSTLFTIEPVGGGFSLVTDITHAGDDRLFVAEKPGLIHILHTGSMTSTIFLDIRDRIKSDLSEQGLLGIAFPPDYGESGRFYVHYTTREGDTQLSRFWVTEDPNVADPDSEEGLFFYLQPSRNHNGGALRFGPDGMLYLGLGDGGFQYDPLNHGQNIFTPLGSILRLDVSPETGYAIPENNPFVNISLGVTKEIWAYGFRNPWRISFDRVTGDLFIADVGEDHREEVNVEIAGSEGGKNYGWRCFEGTYNPPEVVDCPPNSTFPDFEYAHTDSRCAVTGGYVYRGLLSPNLVGHYLFSDFCTQAVMSLTKNDLGEWEEQTLLSDIPIIISTFGEGYDGEVYIGGVSFVPDVAHPIYHIREVSLVSQVYVPMLRVGE